MAWSGAEWTRKSGIRSKMEKDSREKQVQSLEVACDELKSLPPSRPVYEKRGTLYFQSDTKKLLSSKQKELDKAKSRSKKL